jgi:hypothetical protein
VDEHDEKSSSIDVKNVNSSPSESKEKRPRAKAKAKSPKGGGKKDTGTARILRSKEEAKPKVAKPSKNNSNMNSLTANTQPQNSRDLGPKDSVTMHDQLNAMETIFQHQNDTFLSFCDHSNNYK